MYKIFFILFPSVFIFSSILFFPDSMKKKRNNPADPGGINFQGYSVLSETQFVQTINEQDLLTGNTTVIFSNFGSRAQKYMASLSADFRDASWDILPDNRIYKYILPGPGTWTVYSRFLLNNGRTPCCTNLVIIGIKPPGQIKIASFNLQNFSTVKSQNKDIVRTFACILTNFDLIGLQEIKSESAMLNLHNEIKNLGLDYNYLLLKSGDEYYSFIYRSFITVSSKYYRPEGGFIRPPLIAHFTAGNFDFAAINIHCRYSAPGSTAEISNLAAAAYSAMNFYSEKDIIILGDFNADNPAETGFNEITFSDSLRDASLWTWVIRDSEDTTAGATDWTYDRIVINKENTSKDYCGQSGVFRYDEKMSVTFPAGSYSDHYPVWALFSAGDDND
ncbi:MAG: hypothetical protein A2096_15865 [Spirochaetes bacterium GWF1_41_5]|nr:MAG: hypothetical protein A2096_15865 [Spirochaetes bacterium GWF1_41_5]